MTFNWNNARAFFVAAKNGSLSAAAKILECSQPTVSRQVTAFEKELGVILFERTPNKLLLTPHGERIYLALEQMDTVSCDVSIIADSSAKSLAGKVILAVSELDSIYRLPIPLSKFHRAEPEIKVRVIASNESADLLQRDADIAIRHYRPVEENLIARKVGEFDVYLYSSEDYQANGAVTILGFENNQALLDLINKQQNWSDTIRFPIRTNFQPLQIGLAQQGLGCVLLPMDIGERIAGLRRYRPELGPITTYSTWLVCHQELRTSLRIKRLFDFLAHHFIDKK